MGRTIHMCISVRGVLANWKPKMLKGMFEIRDEGRPPRTSTAQETREILLDELQKGHAVIPLSGEPCEGFDYSGGGCPGHERIAPDAQ